MKQPPVKRYDRAYFDRWYRDPRHRVRTPEGLQRKVRFAVSLAEYLLGRTLRTVLDIGCGEGAWYPVLRRIRPDVHYIGVDSSEYAVSRFGVRRNIHQGTFASLATIRLPLALDLIVCSDVLQYVTDAEAEAGLRTVGHILRGGGVAFIEAYASEDVMEGDRWGWHERSSAAYRRMFGRAGLVRCGPHAYFDPDAFDNLDVFEGGVL
jgi:SAM-dependent methyltransferase